MNRIKTPLSFILLGLVLILAACRGKDGVPATPKPTATNPSPTLTPTLTPTPLPPNTPTSEPIATPSLPKPLATAAVIQFAGWSPDSRWVAYWTYTWEEIDAMPDHGGPFDYPPGVLHFHRPGTGLSCKYPYPTSYRYSHPVFAWQTDGRAAVWADDDLVRAGAPCGDEFETLTGIEALIAVRDPSISPGHTYRAETIEQEFDEETEVLSFLTIITEIATGQEKNRVEWGVLPILGRFYTAQWVSDDLLLIPESTERGPLLVTTEGVITDVVSAIFGLTEDCFGKPCAVSLRAAVSSDPETGIYHLVVFWIGNQAFEPLPKGMLYHSETQETETFQFNQVYWDVFSSDGKWLLLMRDQTIWARALDPVGSRLTELPAGVWHVDLSPDGKRVAFNTEAGEFQVQTFPAGEPLLDWNLNPTGASQVIWSLDWSLDGAQIAVVPSWFEDEQKAALYIFRP